MELVDELVMIRKKSKEEIEAFKTHLPCILSNYLKEQILQRFIEEVELTIRFSSIVEHLKTHNAGRVLQLRIKEIPVDIEFIQETLKGVLNNKTFRVFKPHIHFKQEIVRGGVWFNGRVNITSEFDFITFVIPEKCL